ncbi:MAG: V-type ATP synthase subunit D [Candidatus Fimadaptatus sp.]
MATALRVNPTRMELTRLKRRLKTATRGHKLLKDKRDEMMRRFVLLIRENQRLRLRVEEKLGLALGEFALCRGSMDASMLEQALLYPVRTADVEVGMTNIMSVKVPTFRIDESALGETQLSYGLVQTSAELDGAIAQLADVLPDLIALTQIEKTCDMLADEIEKTRRRVNALEYVMIPQFEETIRTITMKLEENERGTTTRLMKVKDMIAERDAAN